MKTKIRRKVEQEIEIVVVEIDVPHDSEDEVPADFPGRTDERVKFRVEMDTGKIEGWTRKDAVHFHVFPRDSGTYRLIGAGGVVLHERRGDYVPNYIVPGEYGDSIDLKINANGTIANWPIHPRPDVSRFFLADGEDSND